MDMYRIQKLRRRVRASALPVPVSEVEFLLCMFDVLAKETSDQRAKYAALEARCVTLEAQANAANFHLANASAELADLKARIA